MDDISILPARKLVQFLFLLDNGDKTAISNKFETSRKKNEYYSSKTLEAFKKTLEKASSGIKPKDIVGELKQRSKILEEFKLSNHGATQPDEISFVEQDLLTFVAACTLLEVPCSALKEKFDMIKKRYSIREDTSDQMFLFTENIRIISVCNMLSSQTVLHLYKEIKQNDDLNQKLLKDLKFTKDFLDSNEGLKDLLFLYIIRYLETHDRFNKLYCHHIESILETLLRTDSSNLDSHESKMIQGSIDLLGTYCMNSQVPGYCTILCCFTGRNGAINEAENVMETFLQLGYHVKLVHNPTRKKIQAQLTEMKKFKYSLYDSSVVWIMAHGDKESITMSNGDSYDRKKLLEEFSLLEAFKRKPKIMFMTTCQGEKYIPLQTQSGLLVETDSKPITLPIERENLTAVYFEMDRLISYSTLPEQYSYRNNVLGSYFVDIVCKLLKEERDRNITNILERVTQQIHTIIFQTSLFKGKAKQASFYESTLQKKFIFPPITKLLG